MPEPKKTREKKISLVQIIFDEALKGLLETELPKEKQEKETFTKQQNRSANKKTYKYDWRKHIW